MNLEWEKIRTMYELGGMRCAMHTPRKYRQGGGRGRIVIGRGDEQGHAGRPVNQCHGTRVATGLPLARRHKVIMGRWDDGAEEVEAAVPALIKWEWKVWGRRGAGKMA